MNGFSPRAVAWLIGLCSISFAVALILGVVGGDPSGRSGVRADGRSVSAVGHRAFLDLLRQVDVPVIVSEYQTEKRASASTLVVFAEPDLDVETGACIHMNRVARDVPMLVVLPKWRPTADPAHPSFAGDVTPVARQAVKRILGCVDLPWEVQSSDTVAGATITRPQLVVTTRGAAPALVATTGHITVLADPDPIENHGLDDGDNADFAVDLVRKLLPPGGVVLYDETLHGRVRIPSLWRELFTFPWSLVSASALVALGALLLARTRRFGAPAPTLPAIAPGKQALIDNTAALLAYGGHAAHALERYLAAAVADVTANQRRTPPEVAELEEQVRDVARNPARALGVAERIHRFRKEMLDGSTGPRRP